MNILCKVITETTTSDYSYPVRVSCDDTATQAPSSLLTNLICENFYLGLRKLKELTKKQTCLVKRQFPKKKATAIN